MTAGYDICRNIWKDFSTLHQAVGLLANRTKSENIHFLVIGAERRCEKLGGIKVHFLPFISDQVVLSDYYRAADIYLHGALVESFGNTLLEAKACATAIVAPAVGGIVEHVRSLSWTGLPRHIQHYSLDESQGLLTGSGDCSAMANALEVLIEDRQLAEKLGQNGALDAVAHYTLDRQANTFVNWYREILSRPSADL
jgi:glycosyltransferase involved in cell wall biosynthesis